MSKPKNMTPEQEAAWKESTAARDKAYYEANKEKVAARHRTYREANKEKLAAREKAYREANKEKVVARHRTYRELITDQYAAQKLGLKKSECPPELIEMKREQLLIARMTKELDQLTKEQCHE